MFKFSSICYIVTMFFNGADGSNVEMESIIQTPAPLPSLPKTNTNTNTLNTNNQRPSQHQQRQYPSPTFTELLNADLANHSHRNIIVHHHQQLVHQQFHSVPTPSYPSSFSFPPPHPRFSLAASNPHLGSSDLSARNQQQRADFERDIENQCNVMQRQLTERLKGHYEMLLGISTRASDTKVLERDLEIQFLRDKTAELERNLAKASAEIQALKDKVKSLESTNAPLRAAVMPANANDGQEDPANQEKMNRQAGKEPLCVEEEAESSFVDPAQIALVHLECRSCHRQPATVMMWPCKHVSACRRCDQMALSCPVCGMRKETSTEVFLCPSE